MRDKMAARAGADLIGWACTVCYMSSYTFCVPSVPPGPDPVGAPAFHAGAGRGSPSQPAAVCDDAKARAERPPVPRHWLGTVFFLGRAMPPSQLWSSVISSQCMFLSSEADKAGTESLRPSSSCPLSRGHGFMHIVFWGSDRFWVLSCLADRRIGTGRRWQDPPSFSSDVQDCDGVGGVVHPDAGGLCRGHRAGEAGPAGAVRRRALPQQHPNHPLTRRRQEGRRKLRRCTLSCPFEVWALHHGGCTNESSGGPLTP